MVGLAILSSGAMLFFSEAYPQAVSFVLMTFVLIGVAVIIFNLAVVLQTVRHWSWKNMLIVSLTVANFALTGVLLVLFRYFSQPLAGTGSP